jgi:hypothetical protein
MGIKIYPKGMNCNELAISSSALAVMDFRIQLPWSLVTLIDGDPKIIWTVFETCCFLSTVLLGRPNGGARAAMLFLGWVRLHRSWFPFQLLTFSLPCQNYNYYCSRHKLLGAVLFSYIQRLPLLLKWMQQWPIAVWHTEDETCKREKYKRKKKLSQDQKIQINSVI